jgi:Flp pilus assembly protein TadG
MMRVVSRGILNRIGGPLRDRRAGVAVIIAFATLPLLAAGGLAIDISLAYMLKNSMSKALDAAGLAAGSVAFETYAADDAQKFFNANFDPGQIDGTLTSFSVSMDARKENITLTATASMPTRFMHIVGFDTVNVTSRALIVRANKGMELVLVTDNTGSMRSGGKMDASKAAAHDLIDIIYGSKTTLPNVWVALVPYTATVNIGTDHWNWLDGADRANINPSSFGVNGWKGCVEARTAPHDQNDRRPAGNFFTSYYYEADTDNVWLPIDESNGARNNGTGPNLGCGPAITPLTPNRATMDAAITEMLPWHRGGTTGNLGLSWGWRAISPDWRGMWNNETPPSMPLNYGEPLMEKVVVMMTDGQNQFYDWPGGGGAGPNGSDYTAYGRLNDFGYATLGAARQELDNRMANTCALMQAEGIMIYTLTFGSTPSAATQNLYRNCATSDAHYFHAPSNGDLSDAFRAIGNALSNLRIAE